MFNQELEICDESAEISQLKVDILSTQKEISNVRRGLFQRFQMLEQAIKEMKEELESLKKQRTKKK